MIRCKDCVHFMHNICTCAAAEDCGDIIDENHTCKCAKTKYVVGSKWNLTIPRLVDYSKLGENKRVAHEVRHCKVAGAYSYHVLFVDSKGIKHSYTYRELEQMESKGRIEEVTE